MRLIDADKLRECYESCDYDLSKCVVPVPVVLQNIDDMPTVNAEPVVRCKDCFFYDNGEDIGWCIIHSHYISEEKDDWTRFNEDDYCSQGKKIWGADNG